jgi:hypothetical protein
VGTSGWSYDHWAGVLYPMRMSPAARLARYAEEFNTVELNASFIAGRRIRLSPAGASGCPAASRCR